MGIFLRLVLVIGLTIATGIISEITLLHNGASYQMANLISNSCAIIVGIVTGYLITRGDFNGRG